MPQKILIFKVPLLAGMVPITAVMLVSGKSEDYNKRNQSSDANSANPCKKI